LCVEISFRREPGFHFFRFCSRLRTSAHGVAAEGSARCSVLRRSNSLRCAEVSGIASLSEAMLSQISSITSRRFLTLRFKIS
jgi:hypothetical protein